MNTPSSAAKANTAATEDNLFASKPVEVSPLFSGGLLSSAHWGKQVWQQSVLAANGIAMLDGFALRSSMLDAAASASDWPQPIRQAISASMHALEKNCGKQFDSDQQLPLLLSLQLDYPQTASPYPVAKQPTKTVLNLGLTSANLENWLQVGADRRQVWDAWRRQAVSWGRTMLAAPAAFIDAVDALQQQACDAEGVEHEAELSAEGMETLGKGAHALLKQHQVAPLGESAWGQLREAISGLWRTWQKEVLHACSETERDVMLNNTSLLVQQMSQGFVPGGGAGRLQCRVPLDGQPSWHGAFLPCAQLEDLSLGCRIPQQFDAFSKASPQAVKQLKDWLPQLEILLKDALQLYFVLEADALRVVSVGAANRSEEAALRIALDMRSQGHLDENETMALIKPKFIRRRLYSTLDTSQASSVFCKGLPASPGCAVGRVVFFAEHVEEWAAKGEQVILVRHETTPEDIDGLKSALGVLTTGGGYTSHAALVARGMGKCGVVGAARLEVDYVLPEARCEGGVLHKGDWISMDGNTGKVYLGQLPQLKATLGDDAHQALTLADATRRLQVRANADTAEDARRALENGAEGIGLCRTEHMFFDLERITPFRKMILSDTDEERQSALDDLLPLQRKDFVEIFRVMKEHPVTIRLLDPPLHEFLPKGKPSRSRMAKAIGVSLEDIQRRVNAMAEQNPMMGRRGCRLAFTHPAIYRMQTRAILEAVALVYKEGIHAQAEIMIPLISDANELRLLRADIMALIAEISTQMKEVLQVQIGAMVETPRAAVCADQLARHADFLSFGTNDLTQMTYGISRDDTEGFLPVYMDKGVLAYDPFITLDAGGVGKLLQMAVQKARGVKPSIKLGICGEHGGDAPSVWQFHQLGLDYISCSPFRLLEARLGAGQAAAEEAKAVKTK